MTREILQIVPRAPGSHEGVGDYAQLLADRLREKHNYLTTFIAAENSSSSNLLGSLEKISEEEWARHQGAAIVLHFSNYGYHPRGIPRQLPAKLARIKSLCGGRLITIFHELYASGSWRQSAFWLRPLQQRIVRALARQSEICIVSSAPSAEQLRKLSPNARIIVRPVPSNFGEPHLTREQIGQRSSRTWAICGGTALLERSLRSFLQKFSGAADLIVIGGADHPEIRALFSSPNELTVEYLPDVEAAVASTALSRCAFGWIDYFVQPDAPTAAILKSTAFAAYCAHGVIPVLPNPDATISLGDDALLGPFSLANLPTEKERPAIAAATYDWYQRNGSSALLAEAVAAALES